MDFVNQKTKAWIIHEFEGPAGIRASCEEEMDRVTEFIDQARQRQPTFHYNRNTVYLRFSHSDYHKGSSLGELSRLLDIPRDHVFAAGDHHNDISMLDGRYAAMPACPANAIPEVKAAVAKAGGFIAEREHGAGVYDALRFFTAN
jgi:hydroxymethylpyrimidine pyrophosphatase-like HAD family hydrolase